MFVSNWSYVGILNHHQYFCNLVILGLDSNFKTQVSEFFNCFTVWMELCVLLLECLFTFNRFKTVEWKYE